MYEIADRAWAWQALEEEYKDRIQTDFRLMKEIQGQGGRASEIANILKKKYGTSGHSLDSLDPADGVCGFVDFNAKGVHVTRYSFDPDSDPEETDNDQETEIHFTWNEYARAVIHWMNGETWAEALNIPAKQKPGAEPADKKGQEDKTMTMLANRTEAGALTLADYEARIHLYKEQIGTGYIGIGRTLNEAKDAGVVPHGQWEAWVTKTTGLTPRQAQRCMQAATEIKDGSALARLEMSKALMLLGSGLDEDEQEVIAEKAAAEGTTVKALKEELRKAKLQIVQETGASAEIREELKKIRSERESMEHQLKATIEAYQKRMDEECGNAYRRGLEDQATGLEKEIRKEFQDKIDHINSERTRLEDARKDLLARLEEEKKDGSARWDEGFEAGRKEADGLRNELNKQTQYAQDLKKNQDDLLAAAEEAEKRAADAEAELEALKAGQDPGKTPAAITLARAVNAFMAECELMPWYPAELQAEAGPIRSSLEQLDDWCTRMHGALVAAVPGEGAVE